MSEVDCNQVWEEMSNSRFENLVPSSKHNRVSISKLQNLIQEALRLLRHPDNLNRVQCRKLKIKVRQMRIRLARESVLARWVDPSIP